ncbi:NADPH-dependent FMN reductase [Polaribacter glomeratus]|uniref:NADPH-dependent FMN reductase n=1 Tax=Polaribacter glomeratus TaxID=102 RepID=A0A2S7WXV7_9FLAO|nr:NAD(P)H-dependent oxidoreductase [Polaribacter glomeratus]PQJ82356.1 NADPH-dependent FMN reductase [Polaribacter glomeratus]TXD64543.1 NAD(P)H-dependent oxidoreductase [Polaribacter glomeratus]
MKKVLVFAGSTSSTSINKKLATFAAQNLENSSFDVIDLRDFNIPIYSTDEEQNGFPADVKKFTSLLDNYDGFILSLAEHNGSYAAAFKNVYDWTSRIEAKIFRDKPLLLMATSPGARGGKTVLETGSQTFSRMGAKELISFSLPSFNDNFKEGKIINEELLASLKGNINKFENFLNQ